LVSLIAAMIAYPKLFEIQSEDCPEQFGFVFVSSHFRSRSISSSGHSRRSCQKVIKSSKLSEVRTFIRVVQASLIDPMPEMGRIIWSQCLGPMEGLF